VEVGEFVGVECLLPETEYCHLETVRLGEVTGGGIGGVTGRLSIHTQYAKQYKQYFTILCNI
jgi:hypothetical protein